MRAFRKSTILDVARKAGVSHTTVSLFLKGHPNACSAATGERIREAIEELQYTPSASSKGIKGGRTHVLGVSLHTPESPMGRMTSSFSERVWSGLMGAASRAGVRLLMYPESDLDGTSAMPFLSGQIDGLIISESSRNARLLELERAGMPTVTIGRNQDLPDGVGAAYADESQAIDLLLTHLRGLGHKRFAHLAGPATSLAPESPDASDIAEGRLRAMREVTDLISSPRPWAGEDVETPIRAWMARSDAPTAIIAANDRIAMKALAVCADLGISVPDRVSIVGIDNDRHTPDELAGHTRLTSVDIPCETIGRAAVEALERLIGGSPVETCRVCLPVTTLEIGTTSGPVS